MTETVCDKNGVAHTKGRNSNFELLRIVCILMILLYHFTGDAGVIADNLGDLLLCRFVSEYGQVAVLIFILITGYFMINKDVNYYRILGLIAEVWFYSIVVGLLLIAVGWAECTPVNLRTIIFPIFNENWWFITYYMGLMLFVPLINAALHKMNSKQHLTLVIALISIGCIIPSILNYHPFGSLFLFVGMYCTAAYIKMYPNKYTSSIKFNLSIFLFIAAFMLTMSYVMVKLYYNTGLQTIDTKIYSTMFFGICILIILLTLRICKQNKKVIFAELFILPLIGLIIIAPEIGYCFVDIMANQFTVTVVYSAIALFLVFKNIHIGEIKIINWVAASVISIYLIHCQRISTGYIWTRFINIKELLPTVNYSILMICSVLSVFVACLIIDKIRIYCIFKPLSHVFRKQLERIRKKCESIKLIQP